MPMHNPPHPGEILKEEVLPELGLTVGQLAEHLGVSRPHLSRVLGLSSAAESIPQCDAAILPQRFSIDRRVSRSRLPPLCPRLRAVVRSGYADSSSPLRWSPGRCRYGRKTNRYPT